MWFIVIYLVHQVFSSSDLPPPCFSDIYCHGDLLHTIQMAKIYEDSKTFVDMKMRYPRNETLKNFNEFMIHFNSTPNRNDVEQFVNNNFEPTGQEFEDWDPVDWIKHPKFLDKIEDRNFRNWASDLNAIWKNLGRKMKAEVKDNKDLYSIIWIPHPVIVPGGRFREVYYWDSYWIVQGLLLSEMVYTVRGILENFLYMVDHYGHIPNGGRIYYLARSQPPLLTPMIKSYYDYSKDYDFVVKHIDTMEMEFSYWMTNHTATVDFNGKEHLLAVYGDQSSGPRPESYSEDVDGAVNLNSVKKEAFYSELKAGAESGWDFSSRWFITNATNKGNLTNIKTRSIVPVDLNAIIYWNAVLLSEFNEMLNRTDKAKYFSDIAEQWLKSVTAVLWHEEAGSWLDYDMQNAMKRDYFYPSNLSPLWTGCYDKSKVGRITKLVLKYLQNKHIMNNPGGIPATMEHTGEQWDYPNAWPPLQHIMIVGLNNTGDEGAQRLAFEITKKWVRSNYKAYKETAAMFEKYDATVPGGYGGGGEYELQLGFGWTNGIIMDLLNRYSDTLRLEDEEPNLNSVNKIYSAGYNQVTTVLLALLVSLAAGFIGVCIYKRRGAQQSTKGVSRSKIKYTPLDNMTQDKAAR